MENDLDKYKDKVLSEIPFGISKKYSRFFDDSNIFLDAYIEESFRKKRSPVVVAANIKSEVVRMFDKTHSIELLTSVQAEFIQSITSLTKSIEGMLRDKEEIKRELEKGNELPKTWVCASPKMSTAKYHEFLRHHSEDMNYAIGFNYFGERNGQDIYIDHLIDAHGASIITFDEFEKYWKPINN